MEVVEVIKLDPTWHQLIAEPRWLNAPAQCVVVTRQPDYRGPAGREYATHCMDERGALYLGHYDLTLAEARDDASRRPL